MVQELSEQIIFWSKINGLNPDLVAAICAHESSFNPNVMKYEPTWKYTVNPKPFCKLLHVDSPTEITLQKFSYGLMQCMGSVAREYGFTDYFFKMLQVDNALQYGCKHLKVYLAVNNGDETKAISSYNWGHVEYWPGTSIFKNQPYIDSVNGFYQKKLISSL